MLEAYRFGVAEGPHPVPWTADFHRDAVHIFAESPPSSYQRDVAQLYFEELMPMSLGSSERQVLRRLVAGVPIADVASELGYSERSMYRELSRDLVQAGSVGPSRRASQGDLRGPH